MWCRQCQQDVPGKPDEGKYACPRCGEELSLRARGPVAPQGTHEPVGSRVAEGTSDATSDEPVFTAVTEPPPVYDSWELEEQLRHIERVLALDKPEAKQAAPKDPAGWARLDAAHGHGPAWHVPTARKAAAQSRDSERRAGSRLSTLTWSVLSLGSMGLACGGVLMVWSVVAGRDDLWSVGTPIVLVAQLVLLIGFILQLDRLGYDSRSTSDKLEHVGQRLDELNTTTSLLGTSHTSPAASFYSHMAGGANPQLLLADLKSQLDLLALKISRVDG